MQFHTTSSLVFGVESRNLLLNAFLALGKVQLDLLELQRSVGSRSSLLGNLSGHGVGTDGFVGGSVHTFHGVSGDSVLDEAAELLGVAFRFIFLELTHVVSNVTTENVLADDFTVSNFLFIVVTGETLFGVRNVQTTIDGTLHGGEDLGTSAGTGQTNVQEGLEGTTTVFLIEFGLVETELDKGTTSAQQTSAVNSSVVGQTNLDTESGKFVSISRGKDDITLDLGINDLANDVSVGNTDNETVLGGVVLVLVLDDQTLASVVISLTLTATTILDLVTLVVSPIFLNLLESLNGRNEN